MAESVSENVDLLVKGSKDSEVAETVEKIGVDESQDQDDLETLVETSKADASGESVADETTAGESCNGGEPDGYPSLSKLRSTHRPLLFSQPCAWETYNCYGQMVYCENVYVPPDLLMSAKMVGRLIGRESRMIKGWEQATGAQVRIFGSNPFCASDRSGWFYDAPLHARVIALNAESRAECTRLVRKFLETTWSRLSPRLRYQFWLGTSRIPPPSSTSTQTDVEAADASQGIESVLQSDEPQEGSGDQRSKRLFQLASSIMHRSMSFVENAPDLLGIVRNAPIRPGKLSDEVHRFMDGYVGSFTNVKKMVKECVQLQDVLKGNISWGEGADAVEVMRVVELKEKRIIVAFEILKKREREAGRGDGQTPRWSAQNGRFSPSLGVHVCETPFTSRSNRTHVDSPHPNFLETPPYLRKSRNNRTYVDTPHPNFLETPPSLRYSRNNRTYVDSPHPDFLETPPYFRRSAENASSAKKNKNRRRRQRQRQRQSTASSATASSPTATGTPASLRM